MRDIKCQNFFNRIMNPQRYDLLFLGKFTSTTFHQQIINMYVFDGINYSR